LEHDITGAQTIGFKIFKKVKMEENDRLKLNLIPGKNITRNYEDRNHHRRKTQKEQKTTKLTRTQKKSAKRN
jgi:hypothetical protein